MQDYGPETYGDRWADVYDAWVGAALGAAARDSAVASLADLAANGPVLELGIGTGRLALPLAERGLEVHGIDASDAMIAKLRDKPGGGALSVTVSNFADVDVEGEFALIFVAFNTFFALTSQEDQLRCFRNVARRLTAEGVFVVKGFVPDVTRFDDGQTVRAVRVDAGGVELETSRHDLATQTITSQHVIIDESGTRLLPVHLRYAWPSELDLMARLAGLELRERWAGWDRSPFTASSSAHVSVYAHCDHA